MQITAKFVDENRGKRFNITMKDGTVLKRIGFFNYQGKYPCYMTSRQKRRGLGIPYDWDIKSIVEVTQEKPSIKGNAQKILNRIHPNAWQNLQEEYKEVVSGGDPSYDFIGHFTGKLNFRNIKSLFKYEQRQLALLKEAFENKTEFRWSRSASGHQGRDLSIHTKLGEDGVFRAWFSSEYPGCSNGDYYLLLNPTVAIYYERD